MTSLFPPRRVELPIASSAAPAVLVSCGTCRACCIYLAISELDKPAGKPCPHLNPDAESPEGCTLYGAPLYDRETWEGEATEQAVHRASGWYTFGVRPTGDCPPGHRPLACHDFACAWRAGEFVGLLGPDVDHEALRPDRSGLLVKPLHRRGAVPADRVYTCLPVHGQPVGPHSQDIGYKHLSVEGRALFSEIERGFRHTRM